MFYNSISKQRSVLTNYKLCLWGLVGWLGKVSSWLTNGSFLFAQKTRISMTTVRQPICHPPTPLDSLLGESQSSEDVNVSQSKLNHNKKNLYFWTFPKLLHPPSPPHPACFLGIFSIFRSVNMLFFPLSKSEWKLSFWSGFISAMLIVLIIYNEAPFA